MKARKKQLAAAILAWAAVLILAAPARAQEPAAWPEAFAVHQTGVDFREVARQFPRLKTLVLASFAHELGLHDVEQLNALGAFAQSGGNLGLLGRRWAILFTQAGNLGRLDHSPLTVKIVPLTRFKTAGLYQVGFKLVDELYQGPLTFRVSTPRPGFGKKLLELEVLATPAGPHPISQDSAGNRWLMITLPQARKGSEVKLSFYFIYQVDLAGLLAHCLAMVPLDEAGELPAQSQAQVYLQPSAKIDFSSAQVIALANQLFQEQRAPRRMYRAILAFIKDNLPYDQAKRESFFSGKMVYSDMSEMYNPPDLTLASAKAACPSTSVLEAALLRAGGVPARTAGRWGHFYSELFMPGRGWLSTSVTPTGIPLVVDPDQRHQPFAVWTPVVKVQTTGWSGQVKILLDTDDQ